jgi:hypothetical protein
MPAKLNLGVFQVVVDHKGRTIGFSLLQLQAENLLADLDAQIDT